MSYTAMSYLAFVLVATAMVADLRGVSALSMGRRANVSFGFLVEADEPCTGHANAKACDVSAGARGELSAQKTVRPLFVKFHKVGGTTIMELINQFMGVNTNCGRSCGECLCTGHATACTGHVSRIIMQHYVKAFRKENHEFIHGPDATVDTQLIPAGERRQLFSKLSSVPLSWLPPQDDQNTPLVFITLLRNPVERIRSFYYFDHSRKSCHDPCPAKELSFLEWMHEMKDDHEICCEYVAAFGIGSVSTSKKVLASLFDVVGITEDMDDVYVDVAKQFGVPADYLPDSSQCRDNAGNKEDWTDEQLSVAKKIAADDIELYEFARELKRKRQQSA